MKTVKVGGTELGGGRTKICVPIAYAEEADILAEAARIAAAPEADLAEWRIDWYGQVFDRAAFRRLLPIVKERLGEKPLLVTFRSLSEGGQCACGREEYASLLREIIAAGTADLLDVELEAWQEASDARQLIGAAHAAGLPVLFSKHDFKKTPSAAELLGDLERMHCLGADLCKLAVMPHDSADVAELLYATALMQRKHPDAVLITMSMGQVGAVSRVCGGFFGSAMTFGALGRASAPGQIGSRELGALLDALEGIR